jgi:hypothetical protein
MEPTIHQKPSEPQTSPTTADILFMIFLICMLVAVFWIGRLVYDEGKKTEDAKKHGEDLVSWLSEAGNQRFKPGYAHAACAGVPETPKGATDKSTATVKPVLAADKDDKEADQSAPGSWGACLKHLLTKTEFKDMRNPFTGEAPQFAALCVPADRTLAGAIVIEKMIPTPPGSAVPVANSQLVDTDPIEQKLHLRITVCDKGSYPINVGELDF